MNHFKGKAPIDHVNEARIEIHGAELPNHIGTAAIAAKETAIILLILVTLHAANGLLLVFLSGWLVWKVTHSAVISWSGLERLHRVIEEERWEIEHHRLQEKEELEALYSAKGFSGKLLDEVVSVLLSDDNRLLQVMLEEEFNVNLEFYEHPLKQASGAFIGVVGAAIIVSFGLFFLPGWGAAVCAGLVIALSAGTSAQLQKNRPLTAIIWNLAIAIIATTTAFFAARLTL